MLQCTLDVCVICGRIVCVCVCVTIGYNVHTIGYIYTHNRLYILYIRLYTTGYV